MYLVSNLYSNNISDEINDYIQFIYISYKIQKKNFKKFSKIYAIYIYKK